MLPVLGQLSHGYVGQVGSALGSAENVAVEFGGVEEALLRLWNCPGHVALPGVEVLVLALALQPRL